MNFLLEIGCEEIPSRFVMRLLNDLKRQFEVVFDKRSIVYERIDIYATYRRLAFDVKGLVEQTEDQSLQVLGPPLSIAKDSNGDWTGAAEGFAKKVGLSLEQLSIDTDAKGREVCTAVVQKKGKKTQDILPDVVATVVQSCSLPIAMTWGEGNGPFIRPVHWVCALFGDKVVDVDIFGVKSGRYSYGHRFLTSAEDGSIDGIKIILKNSQQYVDALKAHNVCVDIEERQKRIEKDIDTYGALKDAKLMAEVLQLVEWPQALVGRIKKDHLVLPGAVLMKSMMSHQKYFPILKKGKVSDQFLVFSENVRPENESIIRQGNERVLNARLDDAFFFWQEDQKQPLEKNVGKLAGVVFQEGLGSVKDKIGRLEILALEINKALQLNVDEADIKRVALLCKADLVTHMVYEFPELQGVMGAIYATSTESSEVSEAIREHYYPLASGDETPQSHLASCVALAERFDTIVASYVKGELPSGSKDPMGIRRAIYAVLSICYDQGYALNFYDIFENCYRLYSKDQPNFEALKSFFNQRCQAFLKEFSSHDLALGLQALALSDLPKACERAKNLFQVTKDEFKLVSDTAIRIARLVSDCTDTNVDKKIFSQIELKAFEAMEKYDDSWDSLVSISTVMEVYFEQILVMDEDEKIRQNRLSFLAQLNGLYLSYFDFTTIEVS